MTLDYRNQRLTPSPHAISVFLNTKGVGVVLGNARNPVATRLMRLRQWPPEP